MKHFYELINPSDAICFETEDEEALRIAVMILGDGWYGLERDDGAKVLSVVAFSADSVNAAAAECHEFLKVEQNKRRMAAALRTVLYCHLKDRVALEAAFADLPEEQRRAAVARFNDQKRTSLNDIGARALSLAEHFEKGAAA